MTDRFIAIDGRFEDRFFGFEPLTYCGRPAAFDRPEHIGVAHFAGGKLGHHRYFNIAQARFRAFVGCDTRQRPGSPLVVHNSARAVDRVHNHADMGVFFSRSVRENNRPFLSVLVLHPLGDQHQRGFPCPLLAERFENRIHGGVDTVDRIR